METIIYSSEFLDEFLSVLCRARYSIDWALGHFWMCGDAGIGKVLTPLFLRHCLNRPFFSAKDERSSHFERAPPRRGKPAYLNVKVGLV